MPVGVYKYKKGKDHPNWKGGRKLHVSGYWEVRKPEHLRARNGYVFEHVLMAEKALGKPLPPKAAIHHHGAKSDNSQIVVCQDQAYHSLLHQRMRALKACGHANWRKCWVCKEYDEPKNLYIHGSEAYHRKCYNKYRRELYCGHAKIS